MSVATDTIIQQTNYNESRKQMARSGKSISVKIATPKVIKALEEALAKLEKDYTSQEENEAKYNKAYEAWKKELVKFAVSKIAKAENLRANYRSWNKSLNVDFDLTVSENEVPAEPEKDYTILHKHTYTEMKEEITNAIRILKMTDEETVSTSTYNAIARYL
jgi:small-conductance mechanosensitive channel